MTFPPPYIESNDEESRLLTSSSSRHDVAGKNSENRYISRVSAIAAVCGLLICAMVVTFHGGDLFATNKDFIHLQTDSSDIGVYVPDTCPGMQVFSGSMDPRDASLVSGSISGLGPTGFEENPAKIFRTGNYNKYGVSYILATRVESQDGSGVFHMVRLQVTSKDNNLMVCAVEAGKTTVDHKQKLDATSIFPAWR